MSVTVATPPPLESEPGEQRFVMGRVCVGRLPQDQRCARGPAWLTAHLLRREAVFRGEIAAA